MSKELKALAMLFPQVFDGEDLLPDEFMEETETVQRALLSKALFVKLFLKGVDYADNKFSDYDSDELLEVFKLTSQDLLKDSNILETAAMANPIFLGVFLTEHITSEIIFLALDCLITKVDGDSDRWDCVYDILNLDASGWRDPELAIKLKNDLDQTISLNGTHFWIRFLHIAPQELFNNLQALKALLKIFINGIDNRYESSTVYGESYSFWDGYEWMFWTELIGLIEFQQKLVHSPHFQEEGIKTLLNELAECIVSQETELSAWADDKPNKFILFLKNNSSPLQNLNQERLQQLMNVLVDGLDNASEELKADKEIVMAAVEQNGNALEHASEELKADKEIVMAAVKENGYVLRDASEELKADKEIVMAAVEQNGDAFDYASEALKADKEIVLAAVKVNGNALEHASEELKADKEIVLAAVKKNGSALRYASDELQNDKDILSARGL
jgi:lambda repressor-like predicted transcriptional regulator